MNILLSNFSLEGVGGTEKWVFYTAKELVRLGHSVSVFTTKTGITSGELEHFCTVITELPTDKFDLKILNHNLCEQVLRVIPGTPIFTSHGPLNPLEQPAPGAGLYVAVSKEIQTHHTNLGYSSRVITNGIDLEDYQPTETNNKRPMVFSGCKSVGATRMLVDACKNLGYDLTSVHYTQRPVWDMASLIGAADIVVGCGRTAREALACGKPVLVFDGRRNEPRADGWITALNVNKLEEKNFACRTRWEYWNLKRLEEELMFVPEADWCRAWAEENADIRKKVQEYLEYGNGVTDAVN